MGSFVQDNNAATSLCSFLSNVTLGNLMLCWVRYTNPFGSPTVTDTLGSSWVQIDLLNNNPDNLALFAAIAPSSGANTVNVAATGTAAFYQVVIQEWNGFSATASHFDSATGSGTTQQSGTVTGNSGDLVI